MCFPTSKIPATRRAKLPHDDNVLGSEPFPNVAPSFEAGKAGIPINVSPAASFHASTSRIEHERYHNALTTTGSSVREKDEKRQSVRSEDRARTELVTDAADGISNVVVGSSSPRPLQNTPQASHRRQQPSHEEEP